MYPFEGTHHGGESIDEAGSKAEIKVQEIKDEATAHFIDISMRKLS